MEELEQKLAQKKRDRENSQQKIVNAAGEVKLSKLLTLRQRIKRKTKSSKILSTLEQWFWNQSLFKIGGLITIIFFFFTYAATKSTILNIIFNSLEPLGLILAIVVFIRETPERRKQFHYQALSTIDGAAGIRNSKARIIALMDLVDQGINLDELDLGDSNLEGIELNGVELKKGNFKGCNLKKAEMNLANLQKGNFMSAQAAGFEIRYGNMSFANFTNSNFNNANFSHSNFMFSNFTNAKLSGANFKNAKLKGANFDGAYLSGANFAGADVSISQLKKGYLVDATLPDGSVYTAEE
ncbi:MAG: pentapeptide repeat-containing protein [Flavobacteriaceae bacterium]